MTIGGESMPTDKTVRCYRCRVVERVVRERSSGLMPDYPPGWAILTLSGTPTHNHVLCPRHVRTVRAWLAGVVTLEAEQLSLEDVPPF